MLLLVYIETTQSLELVHFNYLQIEPSKANIENVFIVTDISQGMHKHFLLKLKMK